VPESAFQSRQSEVEIYVMTTNGELLKARGRL
jgi:hypothetical protein